MTRRCEHIEVDGAVVRVQLADESLTDEDRAAHAAIVRAARRAWTEHRAAEGEPS